MPRSLTESDGAEGPDPAIEEMYLRLLFSVDEGEFFERLATTDQQDEGQRTFLEQQGRARLLLYRFLVHSTLRRAIAGALPRSVARLGEAFPTLFSRFIANAPPKSRLLRDLAPAFVQFGRNRGHGLGVAGYLWDLAQLESAVVKVAASKQRQAPLSSEPRIDQGLLFCEASQLLELSHAVHLLPEDPADRSLPAARPTYLLAYRNDEHRVLHLELSPLAFAIVSRLRGGESLGGAVRGACSAHRQEPQLNVIEGTAQLLSGLAARGIVLGTSPAHEL